MGVQRKRVLVLTTLILLTLVLVACTRSASTPPPSADVGEETVEPQNATSATMEAVRATILAQTAQAGDANPADEVTPTVAAETPEPTTEVVVVAPTEEEPEVATTEYVVQPGDWIWEIARTFGVDPQVIIDANDLTNPGALEVGMVLIIPVASDTTPAITDPEVTGTPLAGATTYIVQPGDWIWQIARTFGVDPQAIIDANDLTQASVIQPGDELIIPAP